MYTIKDVVSDKITILTEYDLINIEGVHSVSTFKRNTDIKKITVHIGLYDYLFGFDFKNTIRLKMLKDIHSEYTLKFGI